MTSLQPSRLLLFLGASLASLGQVAAQSENPSGDPVGTLTTRAEAERLRDEWHTRILRAERTSFPRRSGALALRVVERQEVSSSRMAAALLTLGASGMLQETYTLEAFASEGLSTERRGAILGLGELGATDVDPVWSSERLLERLLDDPDPDVAACALLALLQSGRPAWRTRARQLAASSGERLAEEATRLLDFVTNPLESAPSPAAELLLDLRWEAAKRYGLVDGRAYSEVLTENLRRDQEFLDTLVLLQAAELNMPAVKDHMLGLLVNGTGTVRLRAVVRSMAAELEKILAANLWEPANGEEWLALVQEALDRNLDRFLPTLFQMALTQEATASLAAGVLGRDDPLYADVLENGLQSPDPVLRKRACIGYVLLGDTTRVQDLRRLQDDEDVEVRALATAARIRLKDPDAATLATILITSEAPREIEIEEERRALIDAMVEIYRFPRVTEFLEAHLGSFSPDEVGGPLACMFLRGRETDTLLLHEALPTLDPGSIAVRRIAEAFERVPTKMDIDFIAEHFPVEGQARLNGILARTLLTYGHPKVMPLIQAAVWDKDWDRSMLAAAVAMDTGGLRTLLTWIDSPPTRADSGDIRRLGFAIGQWKGSEGLDQLRSYMRITTGEANHPELQGALLGYLVSRTH